MIILLVGTEELSKAAACQPPILRLHPYFLHHPTLHGLAGNMKSQNLILIATTLLVRAHAEGLRLPLQHLTGADLHWEDSLNPGPGDQTIVSEQIYLHLLNKPYPLPLHPLKSSHYTVNISVPGLDRPQQVVVDTGSSLLWLPNAECNSRNEGPCSTTVTIGDLEIENQAFVSDLPWFQAPGDGVMGLAPCAPDGSEGDRAGDSVFCTMVKQSLLESPEFSVFLSPDDWSESEILFGASNPSHHTDSPSYIPLSPGSSLWEVPLTALTFDFITVSLPNTTAIFDTGTPSITLPSTLASVLNREISDRLNGQGVWWVECEGRAELPDLVFEIGGVEFALRGEEYVVEADGEEGGCVSVILGVDFPSGGEGGEMVVLGVPFLRAWYAVFDGVGREVGLGGARE